MENLATVGLAAVLFVATNIDDVFVLLGFFAAPDFRARHIVIGQYLGIGALVLVSLIASLVSLVLAPAYVGLLGLLPIAIGVKQLFDLRSGDDDDATGSHKSANVGKILAVAGITVANGGDNIGAYTPVFATASFAAVIIITVTFAVMIALWVLAAHWLVNHPRLGAPIRRYGHIVTPVVLIGIGIFVLYEAGSFALRLQRHFVPVSP
jgi:cadmium resistance protein CadD (predicted permease)